MTWRQGRHYPIHIYDDDRPVATFFEAADAQRACEVVNGSAAVPADPAADLHMIGEAVEVLGPLLALVADLELAMNVDGRRIQLMLPFGLCPGLREAFGHTVVHADVLEPVLALPRELRA